MKFIVDEMLGRLAKWMRIIGLDTLYFKSISDYKLSHLAFTEDRFIVTKDSHLPAKTKAPMLVLAKDLYGEQLKGLLRALKLSIDESKVFSRCLECNTPLVPIEKNSVRRKVPPYVYKTKKDFLRCPDCGKIFWRATHYANTLKKLKEL